MWRGGVVCDMSEFLHSGGFDVLVTCCDMFKQNRISHKYCE